MINNVNRIGNFTSSEIFKLIPKGSRLMTETELKNHLELNPKSKRKNIDDGFSAPGLTYIEEKNIERKLGRSIQTESYSKDMAWGTFLQERVLTLLPYGYKLVPNETVSHKTIPFWSGSTDFKHEFVSIIAETKSYQPKRFAKYTDAIMLQSIENLKENHPEEYWQIVSNSIINEVEFGAAISYMPYKSELAEIREMAEYYDGPDQWKYRFIAEGDEDTLAYLPDDGYYKNLNVFQFVIPQEDIDYLTNRVLEAGKLLIDTFKPTTHDTLTKVPIQ